jgi:NADH dehydrogenase FAD-containing subunit
VIGGGYAGVLAANRLTRRDDVSDPVGYDYLIYAVGRRSGAPGVPGADTFGYPIATLEEAERLPWPWPPRPPPRR